LSARLFLHARRYGPVVCLSVRHKSVPHQRAERIDLVLGIDATLDLSYIVLEGNSGAFKNKDTFLWNFVPNSGLSVHLCVQGDGRNALRRAGLLWQLSPVLTAFI